MTLAFSKVAIIGAGAMGRGIAQIAAQAGSQVWLYDTQADAIQKARDAVFDAGVTRNDADLAAFAQASQPLLSQYRKDPAIDALYRRIRDLA